jgi:hypothetical protein
MNGAIFLPISYIPSLVESYKAEVAKLLLPLGFHREGSTPSVVIIGNRCGIAALSTGVGCCLGNDSCFDHSIKKSRKCTEHASLTTRVYSAHCTVFSAPGGRISSIYRIIIK